MNATAAATLLSGDDPKPVEVLNGSNDASVLLLYEHAGRAVPQSLNNLSLNEDVLISHRAWDIGAENVARRVSATLQAPLVLQRYSRLVIDANRPPNSAGSFLKVSDGIPIPGNEKLSNASKRARIDEILEPMNAAIGGAFTGRTRACFSIHSFTRRMNGKDRPWHAGFLTRKSEETGAALMQLITRAKPALTLALNQPYQIDDETDWFIPRYAEPSGLPHCLIEIRNDQIDHDEGAELWAGLLAQAIGEFMEAQT